MNRDILLNTTSHIGLVYLRDSATGLGKTGVADTDMSGDYVKENNAADVALSFAAGSVGDAYSSGKWAEVGNGYYFYHYPNACWTTVGKTAFSFRASGVIDYAPKFRITRIDFESVYWENLMASLQGIIPGTVTATTTTTTQCSTDLTGYSSDNLIGRLMIWRSGANKGLPRDILDYDTTNGLITFAALPVATSDFDTFVIV